MFFLKGLLGISFFFIFSRVLKQILGSEVKEPLVF